MDLELQVADSGPLLFLSHAGDDAEAALRLAYDLEETPTARAYGLKVFVDRRRQQGPGPGPDRRWSDQVAEVIASRSTAFALYVGADGPVNWVEAEVQQGIARATGEIAYPFTTLIDARRPARALPGFSRYFHTIRLPHEADALDRVTRGLLRLDAEEIPQVAAAPFRGLDPFEAVDRPLFFGRSDETADLLDRLRRHRLVAITGAPGTGKSSLARAGAAALWRGNVFAPDDSPPNGLLWHVVEARPGRNAFRGLGDAVSRAGRGLGRTSGERRIWRNWLAHGSTEQRRDGLRCGLPEHRTRTLVIIDQFEELLTLCPEPQRAAFLALLLDLADESDPSFSVLLTMRSDYYDLLAGTMLHERLERERGDARLALDRMPPARLREAVEQPLRLAGVFDPFEREALSGAVLADVGTRSEDLARIQFALVETWNHARRYGMRLVEAYEAIGTVDAAIARAGDGLFASAEPDEEVVEALALALLAIDRQDGQALLEAPVERSDSAAALPPPGGPALLEAPSPTSQGASETAAAIDGEILVGAASLPVPTGAAAEASPVPTLPVPVSGRALMVVSPPPAPTLRGRLRIRWKRLGRHGRAYADGGAARLGRMRTRVRVQRRRIGTSLRRRGRALRDLPVSLAGRFPRLHRPADRPAGTQQADAPAIGQPVPAESVFVRLVRFGETGGLTRRIARRDEFDDDGWALVRRLAGPEGRHFVRISGRDASASAELASEALIADWPRLRIRLREVAAEARLLDAVDRATRSWLAASDEEEKASRLASDDEIVRFRRLLDERPDWLSPDERAWIAAGIARERDARHRNRRLLLGTSAAALALALVGIGLFVDLRSTDSARADARERSQRLSAARSRHFAELSRQAVARGDPDEGILWALAGLPGGEADKRPWVSEAELGLYAAFVERRPVAVLKHPGPVWSVAFSPDGHRLATTFQDESVRLWNVETGAQEATLEGHTGFVRAIAFSPDDRLVATGSADRTVRLWDPRTGAQLAILSGHSSEVSSLAFSPDGRRLASASADGSVRVWDAATGRDLHRLTGHGGPVRHVVFSPDSARIAAASSDRTPRLWDARTGRRIATLAGHTEPVWTIAFNADGSQIATGSFDKTVRLWDGRTGDQLAVLKGHKGPVMGVAYGPTGRQLASTSGDRTVRIWDTGTGSQLAVLEGHTAPVTGAAFSPDGTRLATISQDMTIRLWDTATGAPLATLAGHTGWISSVAFSPDGAHLATASQDRTARIWNARTADEVQTLTGHGGAVEDVAFSPDGAWIASASDDGVARLWEATSGVTFRVLRGHAGRVTGVTFSSEGKRLATSSEDGTVRLWDVATGDALGTLSGHEGAVTDVDFSRDGARLATASADGVVRFWNSGTGAFLGNLPAQSTPVRSIAFSPDGEWIATASDDGIARIWNVASGTRIRSFKGHDEALTGIAFSPDGVRLATGSEDATARIWNAVNGEEVAVLEGHEKAVRSVAFMGDGTRVATGSDDATTRIWNSVNGNEIAVVRGHRGEVLGVAFSPDGKRLATASKDRTVRVWRVLPMRDVLVEKARETVLECLSREQRESAWLPPEPPDWCIEQEKPPYDTEEWKDWLEGKRAGENPPLPG